MLFFSTQAPPNTADGVHLLVDMMLSTDVATWLESPRFAMIIENQACAWGKPDFHPEHSVGI